MARHYEHDSPRQRRDIGTGGRRSHSSRSLRPGIGGTSRVVDTHERVTLYVPWRPTTRTLLDSSDCPPDVWRAGSWQRRLSEGACAWEVDAARWFAAQRTLRPSARVDAEEEEVLEAARYAWHDRMTAAPQGATGARQWAPRRHVSHGALSQWREERAAVRRDRREVVAKYHAPGRSPERVRFAMTAQEAWEAAKRRERELAARKRRERRERAAATRAAQDATRAAETVAVRAARLRPRIRR